MNLLTIKTLNDGQTIRSLSNYPTENEATSAMFYELWYATSNTDVAKIVCELITDGGNVKKCERWEREVENERD